MAAERACFDPESRAQILLLALQGKDFDILNPFFGLSRWEPVAPVLLASTVVDVIRSNDAFAARLLLAAAACTVSVLRADWNSGYEDVNLFFSVFDLDPEYFGALLQGSAECRGRLVELDAELFGPLIADLSRDWRSDNDDD